MSRTWSFREGTRDDAARINELFVATMGMQRSLAHDHWKFWDNPHGQPYVIVAEDGEKLVGQYALWPVPLRLGSEVVQGAQSLDTMTHPAYQGQGMFTVLANACFELAAARGCEALYGFPNTNSFPGFVRRLNWDHSGNVRAFVRLISPAVHPMFARRATGVAATLVARVLPRGASGDHRIEYAKPADSEIERLLVPSARHKDTCRVDRTLEWYRWRFAPESERDYEWVCAYRNDTLMGWAVWGRDILVPYPRALLSDLVASDERSEIALISASVRRSSDKGMAILSAVASSASTARSLRRCGFFNHAQLPFIVRGLTRRTLGGNIHNHASWRVFGADLDTY